MPKPRCGAAHHFTVAVRALPAGRAVRSQGLDTTRQGAEHHHAGRQ